MWIGYKYSIYGNCVYSAVEGDCVKENYDYEGADIRMVRSYNSLFADQDDGFLLNLAICMELNPQGSLSLGTSNRYSNHLKIVAGLKLVFGKLNWELWIE